MPRERYLLAGGEEAHVVSPVALLLGEDEGCFGVVHLGGDLLHLLAGEPARVPDDGELVARVLLLGEHVDYVEGQPHCDSYALRVRPERFSILRARLREAYQISSRLPFSLTNAAECGLRNAPSRETGATYVWP